MILLRTAVIGPGPIAWSLAAVMVVLALLAIRAFTIFLRQADELLRRIQLEALALGFGAGWMAMLCSRVFERLGAPKIDVSDAMLVMVIFWCLGHYLGVRRYASEATV